MAPLPLEQLLASNPLRVVLIANLAPTSMFGQIRIGLALRHDSFKVVFARQPEQTFTIFVDVVAVEQPFGTLGHNRMKSELAVSERQLAEVLTILESAHLLLIIGLWVFVPQQVECYESGFGTSEKQVSELRLSFSIERDDLPVEHAAATPEITSQSFAQFWKTLKRVSIARDEPHACAIGVEQCPESVPFDLEQPIWMREWRTSSTKGKGLK